MPTDERDDLLELSRRLRTRLAWLERGGAMGLPHRARSEGAAPPPHAAAAAPAPIVAATARPDRIPVAAGEALVEAPSPPPRDPAGAAGLRLIRDELGDCRRCKLSERRQQIVFGVGDPNAGLVFVGEGPGAEEDRTGEPFVGEAGQLLDRMVAAMGLTREQIYICNVVKCRPPGNRNPEPDEIAQCEPFLIRQLGAIAPRLIVALGKFAVQTLLRSTATITSLRGTWRSYQGVPLMPTFHPAYLLRNPAAKREVWADLQKVMAEMDRLGLPRGAGPAR